MSPSKLTCVLRTRMATENKTQPPGNGGPVGLCSYALQTEVVGVTRSVEWGSPDGRPEYTSQLGIGRQWRAVSGTGWGGLLVAHFQEVQV